MQQDGKAGSRPAEASSDEDWADRAAALLKIITYARDEALLIRAEFPAYCLDASLAALEQELARRNPLLDDIAPAANAPSDKLAFSPLH